MEALYTAKTHFSKCECKASRKEITQQYWLGPNGVHANDQELLARPKKLVLNYGVQNKKYWICTIKTSWTFVEDFESNIFRGMHGVIRRWESVPINE